MHRNAYFGISPRHFSVWSGPRHEAVSDRPSPLLWVRRSSRSVLTKSSRWMPSVTMYYTLGCQGGTRLGSWATGWPLLHNDQGQDKCRWPAAGVRGVETSSWRLTWRTLRGLSTSSGICAWRTSVSGVVPPATTSPITLINTYIVRWSLDESRNKGTDIQTNFGIQYVMMVVVVNKKIIL